MTEQFNEDVEDLSEAIEDFYDKLADVVDLDDCEDKAREIHDDMTRLDYTDGQKLLIYLNGALSILQHWENKNNEH